MTLRALALRRHFPISLRSWRFERQPFVVSFRLAYKAYVPSVSPSPLCDKLTKLTFQALALRQSEWSKYSFSWRANTRKRHLRYFFSVEMWPLSTCFTCGFDLKAGRLTFSVIKLADEKKRLQPFDQLILVTCLKFSLYLRISNLKFLPLP